MSLAKQLGEGTRLVMFTGKGGVGKTTCAVAMACEAAAGGRRVLVMSSDPAHSISDSLSQPIGSQVTEVRGARGLFALEIDAETELAAFKEQYEATIHGLICSCTYLDESDVDEFMALTIPGIDEVMAVIKAMSLLDRPGGYDLVVWDTAPTGHTLRLLALPEELNRWVKAFASLRWRYRYVVERLARRPVSEEADEFLIDLKKSLARVGQVLRDRKTTAIAAVTSPEEMAIAETERLAAALIELGLPLRLLVVNGLVPEGECPFCQTRRQSQLDVLNSLPRSLAGLPQMAIPLRPRPARGIEDLLALNGAMRQ